MNETWTLEAFHVWQQTGVEPTAARPAPSRRLPTVAPPTLDRYKSATERRYAGLLALWQQEGRITRWDYEPIKGLYLAPKTSYTPDFLLTYPDTQLEWHETKGAYIRPVDWIKAKQAAALYPMFRFVLAQWKDQHWTWKTIPAV